MHASQASAAIAASVAIAILGDALLKGAATLWSREFTFGAAAYAATALGAWYVLRQQTFGWVSIAWTGFNLAGCLAVSYFCYGEPLTFRRMTASLLLLVAMLLAE